MPEPDYGREINALAAETLVLHVLFTGLANGLMAADPKLEGVVRQAFEYAENILTAGTMKMGEIRRSNHLIQAGEILDQIRAGVIVNDAKR